ncbi:Aste57867_20845 [Aphanomyces stellatus]|uniref:Aste57867_20845 protein n=1 Tax=Aphanomyces stellatus TaxID=120398 RepID=A0A485LHE8_9STRA|nr:hypothetical protein As57867_020777 [Aphanomyces stellatus]VFT97523.1 Aste57867_20845 [Aphanomyces stellatus]
MAPNFWMLCILYSAFRSLPAMEEDAAAAADRTPSPRVRVLDGGYKLIRFSVKKQIQDANFKDLRLKRHCSDDAKLNSCSVERPTNILTGYAQCNMSELCSFGKDFFRIGVGLGALGIRVFKRHCLCFGANGH